MLVNLGDMRKSICTLCAVPSENLVEVDRFEPITDDTGHVIDYVLHHSNMCSQHALEYSNLSNKYRGEYPDIDSKDIYFTPYGSSIKDPNSYLNGFCKSRAYLDLYVKYIPLMKDNLSNYRY